MTAYTRSQALPAGAVEISAAQVAAYLEAAGDDNPLHTDPTVAARAGLAGCPVPGMLLAGLAVAHLGNLPQMRVAGIVTRFVTPVLVGQTIVISGKVVVVGEDDTTVVRLLVAAPALAAVVEVTLARVR